MLLGSRSFRASSLSMRKVEFRSSPARSFKCPNDDDETGDCADIQATWTVAPDNCQYREEEDLI